MALVGRTAILAVAGVPWEWRSMSQSQCVRNRVCDPCPVDHPTAGAAVIASWFRLLSHAASVAAPLAAPLKHAMII